jgi:hypothetical protein
VLSAVVGPLLFLYASDAQHNAVRVRFCATDAFNLCAHSLLLLLLFVLQAANYLNIKGLLDLTCQTVANMIKGAQQQQQQHKQHAGCRRCSLCGW